MAPQEEYYDPMKKPDRPFGPEDGWGADLDLRNRPAVPKEKPSTIRNVRGVVPERMTPTVRIHKSPEHPDLTPVFGTACPPSGLSGRIRDTAYVFSEGRLAHWLLLLLADRVNVVEGMIDDVAKARVPHLLHDSTPREYTGEGSNVGRHVAIGVAVVGAIALGLWAAREYRDRYE